MFLVAIVVVITCNALRIPFLIGYLLTGVLLSPHTSSILSDAHEVEMYAEIGVILLLFSVGLEFSFAHLRQLKKYVLVGGLFQLIFTIFFTALFLYVIGRSFQESIFWGFVISLSSTAIVIKILQDKMMLAKQHGKIILSYLLFQDIAVVPLLLLTPILAGQAGDPLSQIGMLLLKLAGIAMIAIVLTKWLIPPFLKVIRKLQSEEVFLIAVILIVVSIALFTSYLGLSLSLGAFIAGLIIAETDYNKIAISCFIPFRYVFICFFFISLGMLLNYKVLIEEWQLIFFWFVFILIIKTAAGLLASLTLKVSLKISLLVGLSIAQIGEFSFILTSQGLNYGLISEANYHIFLSVAILTMGIAPFIISNAEGIEGFLSRRVRALWPKATI